MAIVRTVLSPSGLVQSQHGLTGYEADQDGNWTILNALWQQVEADPAIESQPANTVLAGPVSGANALPAFRPIALADLPVTALLSSTVAGALGIDGVVSGFTLATGTNLTPSLTTGVLFAQGTIFAPSTTPAVPAAPASATSYLFYNSSRGFYWQASAVAANAGDALIGQVVTSSSAVTGVTQATKIMGQVALAPSAAGNFTVQHFLGRKPIGALIQPTSSVAIWFQSPTMYDATNVYLAASAVGTAAALLW
jgi:hypothetical protein